MVEETSLKFRLRKIDERKNYLLDEINHDLMSQKYRKTGKYLNYVEHLLILALTVTDRVSISAFASLVAISVGIASSAVGITIFAITAGIKNYKKKHDKIVLLGKDNVHTIEVLISKALIDSYISHEKFIAVNNMLG